jgi:hypothetical protein
MKENDNPTETNPTEIPQEVRDRVMAEHYKNLSKMGNQARKGTPKARRHAQLIGLKGAYAARKKAAERRVAKEAGKS